MRRRRHVIITLKPGHRAQMRDLLRGPRRLRRVRARVNRRACRQASQRGRCRARGAGRSRGADARLRRVRRGRTNRRQVEEHVAAGRRDSRRGPINGGPVSSSVTSTLRETLGLPKVANASTPTGSTGVGVVIIDSGITPSANFGGRITGFYDFVKKNGRSAVAVRRLRPWNPRRRADRQQRDRCRTTTFRESRRKSD